MKCGDESSGLVKAWNETCPKSDRIVGGKATSIKHMLTLPNRVRDAIFHLCSLWGFAGTLFADDNLGHKKLAVGASFKTQWTPSNSPWATWGRVTEESLMLFVKHTQGFLEQMGNAGKLPKADFEAKLHHLLHSLLGEVAWVGMGGMAPDAPCCFDLRNDELGQFMNTAVVAFSGFILLKPR